MYFFLSDGQQELQHFEFEETVVPTTSYILWGVFGGGGMLCMVIVVIVVYKCQRRRVSTTEQLIAGQSASNTAQLITPPVQCGVPPVSNYSPGYVNQAFVSQMVPPSGHITPATPVHAPSLATFVPPVPLSGQSVPGIFVTPAGLSAPPNGSQMELSTICDDINYSHAPPPYHAVCGSEKENFKNAAESVAQMTEEEPPAYNPNWILYRY